MRRKQTKGTGAVGPLNRKNKGVTVADDKTRELLDKLGIMCEGYQLEEVLQATIMLQGGILASPEMRQDPRITQAVCDTLTEFTKGAIESQTPRVMH